MPEVQQGDNSRQLKWHQAHKNFYDRQPDYDPPKHRLGFHYNQILKRTIKIVFGEMAEVLRNDVAQLKMIELRGGITAAFSRLSQSGAG